MGVALSVGDCEVVAVAVECNGVGRVQLKNRRCISFLHAKMPLGKAFGVDLDSTFAYQVPRSVIIKDGVIGLANKALIVGCGIALLVQIFALDKGYYLTGQITGASRVQAQAPKVEWSSSALNQSLPFCADSSTEQLPATNASYPNIYTIFAPAPGAPFGMYQRAGEVQSFKCEQIRDATSRNGDP